MTNTTNSFGPVLTTVQRTERRGVWALDVETLDFRVRLVFRSWANERTAREMFAKTRVFGALDAFVPGFDAEELRLLRAITDPDVRDPELARFQRAAKKTAKADLLRLLPVLADALRAAGHEVSYLPEDAKFSIKAGCSMCPCSPGFVADTRMRVDGSGVDLHFYDA